MRHPHRFLDPFHADDESFRESDWHWSAAHGADVPDRRRVFGVCTAVQLTRERVGEWVGVSVIRLS